jgi:hypothetical protein
VTILTGAICSIGSGLLSVLGSQFIDASKPRKKPNYYSPKQVQARMLIGGFWFILIGVLLLIFHLILPDWGSVPPPSIP